MTEQYFHATLTQIEERAIRLLAGVPTHLDGMDALCESCRRDLDSVILGAQSLRDDDQYRDASVQTERLRLLRNLFGQLDVLESSAVAALQRVNDDDRRMTKTARVLAEECKFPLAAPVVSCTSQDYFSIDPKLRLVQIPLTDGRHLLHLADLAHEMAHGLFTDRHNPKVQAFKAALREVKALVYAHFDQRQKDLALGRSPVGLKERTPIWSKSWLNSWIVEFFCDLFGVFAAGPSYGWAHLHLCLRHDSDSHQCPFFDTTSHPANASRTTVIIDGLRMAGFETEADELAAAWADFLHLTRESSDADFVECYPNNLLRQVVEFGFKAYKETGCQVVSRSSMGKCQTLLNSAWQQFRSDPKKYPAWEAAAMKKFYSEFGL